MAPSKSNLVKAGLEGFAMLDEYFGHKGGSKQPPPPPPPPQQQKQQQQQQQHIHRFERQPQKPHVVQVIVPVPVAKDEGRIDCYEAAKLYNGTVSVDYPNAK